MLKPRLPEPSELNQLVTTLAGSAEATLDPEERTNLNQLAAEAAIAVFDEYQADSPGYAGKLLVVVWPSDPAVYEVGIWRNGRLELVPQDEMLRQPTGVELQVRP